MISISTFFNKKIHILFFIVIMHKKYQQKILITLSIMVSKLVLTAMQVVLFRSLRLNGTV